MTFEEIDQILKGQEMGFHIDIPVVEARAGYQVYCTNPLVKTMDFSPRLLAKLFRKKASVIGQYGISKVTNARRILLSARIQADKVNGTDFSRKCATFSRKGILWTLVHSG